MCIFIQYDNPSLSETNSLYNGNISEAHWRTKSDNQKRCYNFDFDALNRLKTANYKTNYALVANGNAFENFDESLSYDKNGNITDLYRKGLVHINNSMDVIDDLDYQYMPFTQAVLVTPKRKPQRFCKILIFILHQKVMPKRKTAFWVLLINIKINKNHISIYKKRCAF